MIKPVEPSPQVVYEYDFIKLEDIKHPFSDLKRSIDEWGIIHKKTGLRIREFVAARDPLSIISRSATQAIQRQNSSFEDYWALEQADVEILLAIYLMEGKGRQSTPTAPINVERLWKTLREHVYSFSQKQPSRYMDNPSMDHAIRTARMQTIYYRNGYVKEDGERVVESILEKIDDMSIAELKISLISYFRILVSIGVVIRERYTEFFERLRILSEANSIEDAQAAMRFFCETMPMAERAWRFARRGISDLEFLKRAGFQLAEVCHSWIYTIEKANLENDFGRGALEFFEQLSVEPGKLLVKNPEHIFLNNPIWEKPLVRIGDRRYWAPVPGVFNSFSFQIFEKYIDSSEALKNAYANARSDYLEDEVERLIKTGLPSAEVYRSVMWKDPSSGVEYENDVLAIVGNTIILFEAKSGRIDPVARRGGELSLVRNFKDLFIEPGEQAWRLQKYLNAAQRNAKIWLKASGEAISLRLETPKVVHKFTICMEHFSSLTNAKHTLKALGLVTDDDAWSPVLSLGELLLVWRHLDSEVSFFHYLTRRATFEEVLDFRGDEMDLLSMYLMNGLFIDSEKFQGKSVIFHDMDGLARQPKIPSLNRKRSTIYGVVLSEYWRRVTREIYRTTTLPHRFDALQVILNQSPASLAGIGETLRRWKIGLFNRKGQDTLISSSAIGKRTFVLAIHLVKNTMDYDEIVERARTIAYNSGVLMFGASDCLVLTRFKRSKETTYDAVSYFRFNNSDR
jgi:hypothetical protein